MLSVIGIHLIFHDYHDNPRSDHFFMACAAIDLQWGDLGHGPETRIRILRTEYASSPGGYIVPTEGLGEARSRDRETWNRKFGFLQSN